MKHNKVMVGTLVFVMITLFLCGTAFTSKASGTNILLSPLNKTKTTALVADDDNDTAEKKQSFMETQFSRENTDSSDGQVLQSSELLPTNAYLLKSEWGAAAQLSTKSEVRYYKYFEEAWSDINENPMIDIELTLLKDWKAQNGSFGQGIGISDGCLCPDDRTGKIVLNLNSYTLDRGLSESSSIQNGNIIRLENNVILTVKNGTLTGGRNSAEGGAIYLSNNKQNKLKIENITFTDNKTALMGGAIYCDFSFEGGKAENNTTEGSILYITDVIFSDNYAEKSGGALFIKGDTKESANEQKNIVYLAKKVIAQNNFANGKESNLYFSGGAVMWQPNLIEGSAVGVNSSRLLFAKGIENERASTDYLKADDVEMQLTQKWESEGFLGLSGSYYGKLYLVEVD